MEHNVAKPRKQSAQTSADKPAKEDGKVTFVRLGEQRLAVAVKRIMLLQNVARYPHSAKQAEKVMTIIDAAVEGLRVSFGPKSAAPSQVSLADE